MHSQVTSLLVIADSDRYWCWLSAKNKIKPLGHDEQGEEACFVALAFASSLGFSNAPPDPPVRIVFSTFDGFNIFSL